MPSDKSGRLTANTRENFLQRMTPHMEKDNIVSVEDRHKIERELNATTLQWGRLLRVGERWNGSGRHWPRIKNALRTKDCLAPPLYGLPKDHKAVPPGEEHLGPALRPVVGATESPNGALSDILTEVLTHMADMADTEQVICLSSEELMASFTDLNSRASSMEKPTILSMDVVSMFPNLYIEKVARVAAEEYLRSGLQVEVEVEELLLYVAIQYQGRRAELETLGLEEVVPRRKHPKAKTVLITTDEVFNRKKDGSTASKFLKAVRDPTEEEVRVLFSLALEEAIKVCMSSHTYSLGEQCKVQEEGGPIGLKLSGAIAKMFMVWWCREFKQAMVVATRALPSFKFHLYKIYVDDQGLVVEELPPGARYLEGEVR